MAQKALRMAAKTAGKIYRVDACKAVAVAKKFGGERGLRALSRCGRRDAEVEALVAELKKNAGTPRGAALREEIVKVVSAARKKMTAKARFARCGGR